MPEISQIKISILPNGKIHKRILNPLQVDLNLVLEGGGPRGLVYIGVLKALLEKGLYSEIRQVFGSSAGALTSLIIALGFSAEEAIDFLSKLSPLELLEPKTRDLLSGKDGTADKSGIAIKLLKDGYLDSGNVMQQFIENVIDKRMRILGQQFPTNEFIKTAIQKNGKITFQDLDNIKNSCPEANIKDFVLTGTKKTGKFECKLFNVHKTPNMQIALAARISASIPVFFNSVVYENDTYCDGGCTNNFPVEITELPEYAAKDVFLIRSKGELGQNLCTLGFKVDANYHGCRY